MSTDDIHKTDELAEEWNQADLALSVKAAARHIPLIGTFELTPRCNFRCKMCYVRMDKPQMDKIGHELTAKEWIQLAEDAAKAGMLYLLITGGEPLLRADFKEIFEALNKMGFIISLNTNAALMNEEMFDFFSKYPPTATNVTLYGASADTYEKICGDRSAFARTLSGLEMFSRIPTVLEVRTSFIKDNMNELDEIRALSKRYTNQYAINTSIFNAIRGAESDVVNCRMAPSEIHALERRNREFYTKLNSANERAVIKNMDTEHFAGTKNNSGDIPPRVLHCLASKAIFWLTWDGKMLPCGTFSSPYTRPLEEGFAHAWNRLPTLAEDIKRPNECGCCEYREGCSNCPANIQAETGTFDRLSPYICAISEERHKSRIN